MLTLSVPILGWIAGVVCLTLVAATLSFVLRERTLRPLAPAQGHRSAPLARPDELHGSGRIYLVQIGPHDGAYSLESYAAWLRDKYRLDVVVLPAMALDSAAWNGGRKQYGGEPLQDEMKREHADLAADPNAWLLGVTDAGMYSVNHDWSFSHTQRDLYRVAVISTAHMRYTTGRVGDADSIQARVQPRLARFLLKDLGLLYWHLSENSDPASVMQSNLDPDVDADDIFESDLDPDGSTWGRVEAEPCIYFEYRHGKELKRIDGPLIRSCWNQRYPGNDTETEIFQVVLNPGIIQVKHSDFYLPDSIPIRFERTTWPGWTTPVSFGISGADNYDKYLATDDDMRHISINMDDQESNILVRSPYLLPVLWLDKWVDEGSGQRLQMQWHGGPPERFEVARYNGEVETYLPCDGPLMCMLDGFRNARGERLLFERDAQRRLTRLTSPGGDWLQLSYERGPAIREIEDSRGRRVSYGYDDRQNLVSVSYPSGEVLRYVYDEAQNLTEFSVQAAAAEQPRTLMRNVYDHGALVRQTLADGESYSYQYDPPAAAEKRFVRVQASDGSIFDVKIEGSLSQIFRRRPATRTPAPPGPNRS